MRTLKFIGLGLLSIVVLLLIVSFLLPSKVHIERTATIKANPATVFPMVNDLKKWELWSPWYRMDPKIKTTYGDTTEGVGGFYSWDSENSNVGNGTMKIAVSNPPDSIKLEMNFMNQGVAIAGFKLIPDGENTKITWSLDADEGMNPVKRLFAFFLMDKMLGLVFEQGLHNLDSVICAMPKTVTPVYNIEVTTVSALPLLSILDSADMTNSAEIGQKYGMNYMEIGTYMSKSKLKSVGAPLGIMGKMGGPKYIWESAIPTDKLGKSEGRIVAKNSYSGEAAFVRYFGSYQKTQAAYEAIYKWIGENGKTENGNAWEAYITDPGMEKDTSKWETDIYVPIK